MIRCQYAVLCEFVRQGNLGAFDLLGVFDRLLVMGLPSQNRQMSFVVTLIGDHDDDLGKHPFTLRMTGPDEKPMFEQSGSVSLKPEGGTWLASARMVFNFVGVVFTHHGKYRFTLALDGNRIAEHVFTIAPHPEKKA